ncbi:MAG: BatA domain-containing protein [Pirellulales bacterium]
MGLSFLTPVLLGGAALVAVPLVLHLIMRRKPVPHEFPALRFLRERAVANRRRLRLSHVLLLLLRMAALVLLAVALARPVLRGAGWLADAEGPVAAAFVFDTAPRMALREANQTRLERAGSLARVLLGKLPAGRKVAVVETAGGAAAFLPTAAAAAARIERLTAMPGAVPLPAAVAEARRLLAGADLARRELYVFTDCSHGAWDNATPQPEIAAGDPAVLYVDVGATAPQNYSLDAVDLSGERVSAGTALAVTVSASRVGPNATRPVAVEIRGDDGGYVRRGVKPVAWSAAAPVQVDFDVAGLGPGTRQGRVLIEGSDDLDADDVRYFTVEVGAAARVIVAAPKPPARTAALFVQAIAPAALAKTGRARFEPEVIDVASLDTVSWDTAQGIVLLDPAPLPPQTWESLGRWVAAGRGLVVWLGPAAGTAERFNCDASRRVLGGEVVRVWRSREGNYLAPATLDHPVLAAFRRVGDAVPWQDYPIARHWEFRAEAADNEAGGSDGEEGSAAAVVAAYRNGLPAIVERRIGSGTVMLVTTPVSQAASDPDAWNTLATGFEPWPFVILANETLLHAIDTADSRNVLAGMPAMLHIERRDVPAAFVSTPTGDDFPAAVDQKRGTITVTATQVPGNYAVRAGGEVGGIAKGFSVNLPPAATDFARVPDDTLATVLGAGHRLARTEDELVRDVNLERVGTELFPWMILLAALAMAADWIVANRFYAPREGIDAAPGAAETFAEEAAATPPAQPGPPPVPTAAVVAAGVQRPPPVPSPPPTRPGPPPVPPPPRVPE